MPAAKADRDNHQFADFFVHEVVLNFHHKVLKCRILFSMLFPMKSARDCKFAQVLWMEPCVAMFAFLAIVCKRIGIWNTVDEENLLRTVIGDIRGSCISKRCLQNLPMLWVVEIEISMIDLKLWVVLAPSASL